MAHWGLLPNPFGPRPEQEVIRISVFVGTMFFFPSVKPFPPHPSPAEKEDRRVPISSVVRLHSARSPVETIRQWREVATTA